VNFHSGFERAPLISALRHALPHLRPPSRESRDDGTGIFRRRCHGGFEGSKSNLLKERNMKKLIAGAALLTAIATPALAADFYIVQDSATKKCTVVDKRPTVTTTTVVGGDKVYTTREEASTAMKTVKVCQ
jgi:hypothetical protein